jgi:hypothetical protein
VKHAPEPEFGVPAGVNQSFTNAEIPEDDVEDVFDVDAAS